MYSPLGLNIFIIVITLWPIFCYSHKSPVAVFYETPDGLGTPGGSCGFGGYGRTIKNGDVTAVSKQSIYKYGAGCGSCYQIKCKEPECNGNGVRVVVTDSAINDDKDFILSLHALLKLAVPGKEKEMRRYGIVEIDYMRVPCEYQGENLLIQILGHSNYPYYLSMMFLFQGGVYDITAVEVLEATSVEWRSCNRAYGAVWEISHPPKGRITLRIFLAGSATASRWVVLPSIISPYWKAGLVYDTSIQIS